MGIPRVTAGMGSGRCAVMYSRSRDPGSDLAADLAAINGSFGILAGEDALTRGRDERMDYLDRLAGA
jgi:hypothetical protein